MTDDDPVMAYDKVEEQWTVLTDGNEEDDRYVRMDESMSQAIESLSKEMLKMSKQLGQTIDSINLAQDSLIQVCSTCGNEKMLNENENEYFCPLCE